MSTEQGDLRRRLREHDLARTLAAVRTHTWRCVRLGHRLKKPVTPHWCTTTDADEVARWFAADSNVGLVVGPDSGVAVLDFDDPARTEATFAALGPLPLLARGRPTKPGHVYIRWEDGLPASVTWEDATVGEIQRGGQDVLQQVVLPPSVHPDTGLPYTWLGDPCAEIVPLPDTWRRYLLGGEVPGVVVPTHLLAGAGEGLPEETPWDGQSPEELLQRAMRLPGARRRRYGVKAQCPACRKIGRDRHRDNLCVFNDGRWSCAVDPEHKKEIGVALGVVLPDPTPQLHEVVGVPRSWVRGY